MNAHLIIRPERPSEYAAVEALITEAFAGALHADGNEAALVAALRTSGAYIPELSLVAERNGAIAGHILFTKLTVGDQTELALAPLAVSPRFQKQGVGAALIAAGHKAAADLGYHWSIVLGSETYYPRFGYRPASRFGIRSPFDVPDEAYMAIPLTSNPPPLSGNVIYADPFYS